MRFDDYLVKHNLARTKSRARNLIMMGLVMVDGKVKTKPGLYINETNKITLLKKDDFASLGEFKLRKALEDFGYSPKGKSAIDIGASNGGFTKVLLDEGIEKVYAVDVGECAFDDELRQDHRVIIKDKLNARYIGFEDIPQKVDLITVDVSFISIKQILPNIKKFLNPDGRIIALIKPQFETQKQNLTKKGIVKTQMLQEIGDDIDDFVKKEGFKALGKTYIHEYFPNKNKEWFIIMQNL